MSTVELTKDRPNSGPEGANERGNVIEVRGLKNCFGDQVVHEGLEIDLRRGEILGVVGGSGTGKSVLMRSIIGLQQPEAGEIRVFGRNMLGSDVGEARDIRRRWGVLFQGAALFSTLTVTENVQLPIREYYGRIDQQLMDEIAAYKLAMVGLPEDAGAKYPAELSGGMKKRAGIRARSRSIPTSVPRRADRRPRPDRRRRLRRADRPPRDSLCLSVFLITHDLDTLYAICDRVAVLATAK
jgi:phospholipid/cholesterol/gamma-HCH transport system ATP-binding protein